MLSTAGGDQKRLRVVQAPSEPSDRSERIRTYNFPQGRVTDHRIGLTLYQIDLIMDGDLDPIIDALAMDARQKALAESAV